MPSPKELAKALAYQGEIRNTSRNRLLGGVADLLAPVSEFADRDKLPESIPLLGGMSFADLSGLKGAQSLVNDMSYGTPPIRGASLQTAKVDPRVLDLAGVSGAMIPVGKALGKAALREGARQIETGTGVLGSKVIDPRQRMFAGEGAKTADHGALKVAKDMKAAGVPDEQIHAKTKWTFAFADGKPRFEIDDSAAKLRIMPRANQMLKAQTVDDFMAHPELLSAHPDLAKTDIRLSRSESGSKGAYLPEQNTIELAGLSDTAPYSMANDVKSTTLHELQHAIQQREGFARGGSPEMFMRGYQNKLKDLNSQVTDINQQMRAVSGTPQYDELMNARSGIVKQIQAIEGRDGLGALEAANKDYRRLAGEAEARLTQSRMNMTPAERAASYPPSMFDVPVKDQIVRYGDNVGGAMMHRPKTTVPNTRSNYETKQDGPFYRVTPRSYGETQGNAGRNTEAIGQSSNRTANAGRDREAARPIQELQQGGALDRRVVPPPELNKPFQIARQYTKATQGTDFVFPDMPVSSFEKQSAIARVHQLALEGSPEYKAATFDAYQRQMPELVEMTGAKNHDEFMEKAYLQFGKEVDEQFKNLPYKLSYHKNGEGNYANSREMNADLHNNGNLNVYQGGERHDFLNKVDKETGLTQNEKFRADHDVFGHGVFGNEFGPKGEEIGYGIHSQMFSPLARIPMASETRGQNSLVNYSPLNSDLFDHIHTLNRAAYHAKQRKDYAALKVIEAAKKEAYSGFQFAPQKAILLPPEFLDLKYAGGIPDYLASVNRPAKSTTFASPLTHYSNKRDLEFTDPNRYGTGIKGQEAERLAGAGDISNRSYFYLGEPGQVRPEAGLGSNVYRSESANLYNLNKDPLNFTTLAKVSNSTPFNAAYNPGVINEGGSLNDIDRLVKLYGYEGLAVPSKSAASMFVPMKLTKPQAIAEALRGRK